MNDLKFALRQLRKSPGFTFVVIITLALGIGANAAIFTLVRGVLIKPLVNRDEDRLIYIRQSAPNIGQENSTWSIPEIQDLKARIKTLSEFGDFSAIAFTIIGLGEPREINGGVVNGSFFEVMGLRPVLGRLVGPQDDGPKAASVVVLTYRFWSETLNRDPSVIGKTVNLGSVEGDRSATIIGVLEPCVPYPQETEIIANVASSPHHLSATMVTERVHRMTELFARLGPGTTLDQARAELRSVYATMKKITLRLTRSGQTFRYRPSSFATRSPLARGPSCLFYLQRQHWCSSWRVPMSRISSWRAPFAAKGSWRCGQHSTQAEARSAACC